MITIPGYQIIEEQGGYPLYESELSLIYRGCYEGNGKKVILKMLKKEYPTPEEIARFRREYEVTRDLQLNGLIETYHLEKHKNTLVMVLEDFGGESLARLLSSQQTKAYSLDLTEFLKLATRIIDILGYIHQQHIIHKDINPSNIVWNPKTDQLKIIDFGIATELSRETMVVLNPNVLEGTLPYMSPEQTGRMNRGIDYRTDFYSLGATFYQMLTHQLPFEVADPMELIHCHIAKMPKPLYEVNAEIPKTLSNIILKLMAKTAEDRYQSTFGLKADLQECLDQFTSKGIIKDFAIGQQDLSDQFQIPQKLYGREKEVETLLKTFDRVSQETPELILVSGYSGIGKSALIHEVHKSLAQKKGYFIEGKFDQFQSDIPYMAISQAFRGLVQQFLSEPKNSLDRWKEQFREAIRPNGQVIIDLIPEMEQIIGEQKPVQKLNPEESQNRFLNTFHNFIKVFAQKKLSLVLFLDDLQWSDIPSLKLIQSLITTKDIQYFFLLGAYRSNEVDEAHPLKHFIDEIQNNNPIHQLYLTPLEPHTVNQMIADTLSCDLNRSKPLTKIVFQKTEGNPFFINELLKNLYREELLYFHHDEGYWNWDLEKIRKTKVSDNVVELMILLLRRLPLETQEILQLAACIGNQFDLKTLSIIHEQSSAQTANLLWEAMQQGILFPLNDQYRLAHAQKESEESFDFGVSYQFQHDRIQQAAYSLIEEGRRQIVHLSIGRLMQKYTDPREGEEKVIEIVRHFNEGKTLISNSQERENLSQLNLIAGKKAKFSTAYQPALQYLTIGKELLPENSWKTHYELTFELYKEFSECAYLSGELAQAEDQIKILLNHTKTKMEKAQILLMQLVQYNVAGKMTESISLGIQALSLLGVKLSDNLSTVSIIFEILLTKWNLGKQNIASLVDKPSISDPEKRTIIRILKEILTPAYLSGNTNLYAVATAKQVNLSLRYGNAPESAGAYISHGMVLGGILGDSRGRESFGNLAVQLNKRFQDLEQKGFVLFMYANAIHPWNQPWKTLFRYYKKAVEAGYQSGDLGIAAFACALIIRFASNLDVNTAIEEGKKHLSLIEERSKYQNAINTAKLNIQFLLNLCGRTNTRLSLNDTFFNEEECLENMKQAKYMTGIAVYHLMHLQLCILYEEHCHALTWLKITDKEIEALMGVAYLSEFCLYAFLTFAVLLPEMKPKEKKQAWKRLKKEHKQMKKWSDHCPVNFLHHTFLMEAEIARLSGKFQEAIGLYEQAIQTAHENEFLSYEALANELTAKFYLNRGKEKIASIYMKDAHYSYTRWGATAKVIHLEENYPQLLSEVTEKTRKKIKDIKTITTIRSGSSEILDLTSVTKASQAISGEIVLETLLKKMMTVLIENAGAQKGYLLLANQAGGHSGQWRIEAESSADQEDVTVLQSIPIETGTTNQTLLPPSIINYVEKTKEPLVLDDASHEGQFTEDPYVATAHPKSILCAPIIHQGRITGIIYLENNLTTRAFTPDRLEVLNLLSSQTAISLENANLYANLEDKVEQRTAELKEAHEKIITLEKETTEKQMAGGFAHEMRNALVGPKLIAGKSLGLDKEPHESLNLLNNRKIKEIYMDLQEELEPKKLQHILSSMKGIYSNEERMEKGFNLIYNSLSRAFSITQLIMDYSKITQKTEGTEWINLDQLIATIVEEHHDGFKEQKIKVSLNLQGEGRLVKGNETHFHTMINNLILNARDALVDPKNKDKGKLTIEIMSEIANSIGLHSAGLHPAYTFRIKDNGIGIPEENLPKIYDAFFSTKPESGTGLGLGFTQKIISVYGGTIDVESKVESVVKHSNGVNSNQCHKGTTFTVRFPIKAL